MHPSFRSKVLVVAAATIVSVISVAASSHAAVGDLYAVTGAGNDGLECGGTLSSLYELDPTNGAAELIGPITIEGTQTRHVTALAMHPTTGVLYAIANDLESDDGCDDAVLLTIDPATAEATVVATPVPIPANVPDMTFDPFGNLYAWSEDSDVLLLIDVTNGTWEYIPDAGLDTFATGLASDSKGRLYIKIEGELFRLNQYTGEAFGQVTMDRLAHNMLAFDAADVMYSGRRTGTGFTLFTIDPDTGATTLKGSNTVFQISALAFDRGVLTAPVVADLSLDKEVDENQPLIGTDVVFTLTLTNHTSGGAAENVVVSDVLPENFFFQSATGDGSYLDTTGEWTVTVPDFSSVSIEITATATSGGAWTNSAEVVSSDSYDPDSVPGSGDTSADTYDEVSGVVELPTLFSIDRDNPYLWVVDPSLSQTDLAQEIELSGYTICGGAGLATQPGTDDLFGVLSVDDCTSQRLVTIEEQTAGATDVGGFGSVQIASLVFGGDSTTLYASGYDGTDTRRLYTVDPADGSLTAECVLPSTFYGSALAFGDGALFDSTLDCSTFCQLVIGTINPTDFPVDPSDPCPYDEYETGTYAEPTAMTIGEIGADYVTLLVASYSTVYEVTLPGEFAEADAELLGYLSHNSRGFAFVDTDVSEANLGTSKSATKNRVKGDKFIEYLLQAHNSGPDAVDHVTLTDEIPVGTTLVSLSSGCGEAGGVVTCDAGTLGSGETEFFTMVVQVACKKCSSISNTVSIEANSSFYDYPFDNTWQISTSVKGKF